MPLYVELDEHDPDKIVEICKALAPTFGGINLEDMPCSKVLEIERSFKKQSISQSCTMINTAQR